MTAFFWGMVGGAIVILANKQKKLQGAAESAGKAGQGCMTRLKFCATEVVENIKDLMAESKMELEAEKASLEEVRLHDEKEN